jgi:diguanylate cyclase (GGDEF)-like protein
LKLKRFVSRTEKNKISQARQAQLDLIGDALDASDDGFAIWKSVRTPDQSIENFTLVLMNKTGADKAGHPQLELLGKRLTEIVPEEDAKGLHALFEKALRKGHSVKEVVVVQAPDGLPGAFENTVVPFGSDLVFATYRDVTAVEREHSRLTWLAEHDFLTGMPNRAKLQESLADSVAMAREKGVLTGFVFIDIDHFKSVNDTYGHDVGDAVLVNFVKRIRNSLPTSALVARIAGDEFAVLLQELERESQLGELMDEVFAAMQRPFMRDAISIPITCSAGCVLTDGSTHPDEVMRIADKAMYRAKFEGRNRFLIEPLLQIT